MMSDGYSPSDARALMPLLDSIRKELEERGTRLNVIEERIEALEQRVGGDGSESRLLIAEAASLRQAMSACRKELERLGCSLLGTDPFTFRIPVREGTTRRSLVWRRGRDPGA